MCFRIEILARVTEVEAIAGACLRETATLGVRWRVESRWRLNHWPVLAAMPDGSTASVKVAARPGAVFTAKVESDAMAAVGRPYDERALLRASLEAQALGGANAAGKAP